MPRGLNQCLWRLPVTSRITCNQSTNTSSLLKMPVTQLLRSKASSIRLLYHLIIPRCTTSSQSTGLIASPWLAFRFGSHLIPAIHSLEITTTTKIQSILHGIKTLLTANFSAQDIVWHPLSSVNQYHPNHKQSKSRARST